MRFGVLWALFVASVKMFIRNRAAVFFSLFLPLIIMLIFGVLNFEGSDRDRARHRRRGGQRGQRGSRWRRSGRTTTSSSPRGSETRSSTRSTTASGTSCSSSRPTGRRRRPGARAGLVAYASNADPAQAQVAPGAAPAGGRAGALRAGGVAGRRRASRRPWSSSRSSRATSATSTSWCPASSGMTIMQLGLFGVAFGFVQLKRTGALRRLFATPTSPAYFLSAQVLSRLIIGDRAGRDPVRGRHLVRAPDVRRLLDACW